MTVVATAGPAAAPPRRALRRAVSCCLGVGGDLQAAGSRTFSTRGAVGGSRTDKGTNQHTRQCAAGMVEAGKQFRRVNGHLHLPALRDALNRHVGTETVTGDCYNKQAA